MPHFNQEAPFIKFDNPSHAAQFKWLFEPMGWDYRTAEFRYEGERYPRICVIYMTHIRKKHHYFPIVDKWDRRTG